MLTGGEVVVKLGQHHLGGKRTTKIGITQVQGLIVVVIDLQRAAGALVFRPVGGVGIQRQVSVDKRPEPGAGKGHNVTRLIGALVGGHRTCASLRGCTSFDIAGTGALGGESGGSSQDATGHESQRHQSSNSTFHSHTFLIARQIVAEDLQI